MATRLPEFKGYTVDKRLQEFRKVDMSIPKIEFVPFSSKKGQELLKEMKVQ